MIFHEFRLDTTLAPVMTGEMISLTGFHFLISFTSFSSSSSTAVVEELIVSTQFVHGTQRGDHGRRQQELLHLLAIRHACNPPTNRQVLLKPAL